MLRNPRRLKIGPLNCSDLLSFPLHDIVLQNIEQDGTETNVEHRLIEFQALHDEICYQYLT